MAAGLGRPSPHPGLRAVVELNRRDLHGLLDFSRIGETLTRQRIAAEQAPPAFLEIEPAGALRDEDVLEARMVREPGAGLQTIMAAQVVGNDENVPRRIVGFDLFEQLNVILGVP